MRTRSGIGLAARNLLHDWGFPFVLLAVWMSATTYTLFLVVRGEPPVRETAVAATPHAATPHQMPVAQKTRPPDLPKS
jgi:hypothetical protein